ncbi:hypothetical protein BDP27DRAFT_1361358 [Rhodocollybia butyracea]|uniref:Uncharacterized protein n=1 Tax=Rhodocollybia butyracea TaxID=206335 RepID=A0A9P5PTL9_9AGAR|nr:hypothetical protein BDP27DRAFT_1361358 [Rhodocollybia butyracea]
MTPQPLNAVSAIVLVSGEIDKRWKSPKIPVVLQRTKPPTPDILDDIDTREQNAKFSLPYPDPPFKLPPSGNLALHISLGKILSEGRAGIIFDCECSIPYGNDSNYRIPPLVVKLARALHSPDLTKEATAYETMLCLQGSAIPRCYGFFQARLLDYFDFGPMSILLLEKVGGRLVLGEPLPDGAESDLFDICCDFAHLRIYHDDLRWANMLSVLSPNQGGLPSLPSPFSGKTYAWRLIDFDRISRTATESFGSVRGYYHGYLHRVIDNVPFGSIVEPWE